MANYKVIATPTSDINSRLRAYKNYLIEKHNEKNVFPMFDYESYMTEDEIEAYNMGWRLALSVAKCNLDMWFPEVNMEVK